MHRQTIDSYNAGADRWRITRRAEPDTSAAAPAVRAFREAVGDGLILDLGCGPGAALPSLRKPVMGLDASLGMLGLIERLGDTTPLVAGDIETLPFAAEMLLEHFGASRSSISRVRGSLIRCAS